MIKIIYFGVVSRWIKYDDPFIILKISLFNENCSSFPITKINNELFFKESNLMQNGIILCNIDTMARRTFKYFGKSAYINDAFLFRYDGDLGLRIEP